MTKQHPSTRSRLRDQADEIRWRFAAVVYGTKLFTFLAGTWYASSHVSEQHSLVFAVAATLSVNTAARACATLATRRFVRRNLWHNIDATIEIEARKIARTCRVRLRGVFFNGAHENATWYSGGWRAGWFSVDPTMPAEVISMTIAHEIGHAALHHIHQRSVAVWMYGAAQTAALASLPGWWAVAGGFVVVVVGALALCAQARRHECEADRWAAKRCGTDIYQAGARYYGSGEQPKTLTERILSTHPTWEERSRFACAG